MAIYASTHSRGTQRVDVVSLGTVSTPQQASLAPGQLHVAKVERPKSAPVQPIAVHGSTNVPSGQRT